MQCSIGVYTTWGKPENSSGTVSREMSEHVSGGTMNNEGGSVLELNVGGVFYSTSLDTLRSEPDGTLAKLFSDTNRHKAPRDAKGKYFIDRDGVLFRYILDYLRNMKLVLPENFHEKDRLRQEAEHYQLPNLVKMVNAHPSHRALAPLSALTHYQQNPADARYQSLMSKHLNPAPPTSSSSTDPDPSRKGSNSHDGKNASNAVSSTDSPSPSAEAKPQGHITVGYRGTFAFGRDGLADVKFRKLSRIIVCGKVSLCREVFKDTLNESRDPDRGETDRYTSRFFLKHTFLEQAFDMLLEEGFVLQASCGSGTNSAGEIKAGMDTEESKWQHYNEFIFSRH